MADDRKPMGMFLQDPSLPELYEDFDFATTGDYLDGTGSSRFCIRDSDTEFELPVFGSLDWTTEDLSFDRFAASGLVDNPQFHQINTFAVLTRTLALVEAEMGAPIRWREGGPLVVRPHGFEGLNAFYDPGAPSLSFGFATSPFRRGPVWTCLSHDIVAHELGHAVLDNFRPLLGFEPDVGALHESIGDLLAMFAALQHEAVVRRMFDESNGDMRRPSVITDLGEEFGIGFQGGGFTFLRSSLEFVRYDESAPEGPHERSVIWTGAIYELMARLVDDAVAGDRSFERFVAAVLDASRWVRGMLLRALHYMPPTGVSLPQLARLIWEADARVFPADSRFRDIARAVFDERGLWDQYMDLTAPDIGAAFAPPAVGDSAALARAVHAHAAELVIPLGIGARLLTPDLLTATRRVDNVTDATGRTQLQTVVERYLTYAFEFILPLQLELDGEILDLVIPLRFGGTLVLDAEWNAVLLARHPVVSPTDEKSDNPALTAVTRLAERTRETITRRVGARDAPFVLTEDHRIVRRPCNLQEHLRGISGDRPLFPFAPPGPAVLARADGSPVAEGLAQLGP